MLHVPYGYLLRRPIFITDNQGMSDLLSPLLFVMKNEVDAFWCFVGFMDRVASNFEFDQVGL